MKLLNMHLKIHGSSTFLVNSNSNDPELHEGTQERSYPSILFVRSMLYFVFEEKVLGGIRTQDKVLWSTLKRELPILNITSKIEKQLHSN